MASENILPLFADAPETPQGPPLGKGAVLLAALQSLWQQDRPQRLLWMPVLWAAGAGAYFALPFEPPLIAALAGMVLLVALSFISCNCRAGNLVILLVLTGFVAAQWKTHSLQQPLIAQEQSARLYIATLSRIEKRTEGGWRLHLDAPKVPGDTLALPQRVRLIVRTDIPADIAVGQRISLRAVLTPLPRPISPGGYDFGRNLYLDGYGATGFAVSPITILGRPSDAAKPSPLAHFRTAVDEAIGDALEGDTAGLAKALLLGDKAELSLDVREAYRRAGLAHLLAISGLHMALVAGFVFLLIRQGLALSPHMALQLPLKSIAAGATIIALFGYLAMVGSPISAQRAAVMATCVMLAIIVGRSAISLRTAAIAAMGLLIFWPENVVNIGFQMSFVAVIALISGYEAMAGTMANLKERLGAKRGAIATYFVGIVLSTVVAEIAVFPLSLYHFNEITVYGLLGNAFAVPVTGFWIMPMGIIGLLLTPFGLAEPAFFLMGVGLDLVTGITQDIAAAPGAFVAARSPSTIWLIVFVGGGLWLCLWRSKLRLAGLAPMAIAPLFAFQTSDPTLLINTTASSIAIKTHADGHVMLRGRRTSFAADMWSRQLGQTKFFDISDRYQRCDSQGCSVYLTSDERGAVVAVPLNEIANQSSLNRLEIISHPAGFRDACQPNALVISLLSAGRMCSNALAVFSADELESNGPLALTLHSQASSSKGKDPQTASSAPTASHPSNQLDGLRLAARFAHVPTRLWHPKER